MASPQYLIIGLDGIPFTLLTDLCEQGVTPHLSKLMEQGQSKSIRSALPDVSSTAWTSFMTGTNPGEHGIYGFFVPRANDYGLRFLNSNDIKTPTLWERLSKHGKRSLVVNVPQTYPAYEIDGILISGFVAPELEKAVWPKSLVPKLQELEYKIDVDAWKAREDVTEFLDDLLDVLERRIHTIEYLWEKEAWDLVMAVFTGTDRLQHYLLHAVEDAKHSLHSRVMEFYHAVDDVVGRLMERVDKNTPIIVLSDHGFTRVNREVNLNAWLRSQGLLTFQTDSPESLEEMNPESTAFALDPGRIYLNRADRFRQGWIRSGAEFDRIRNELRELLRNEILIRDDAGNPVNPVADVFLPEEIYTGSQLEDAPDLLVLNERGFDLKGSVRISDIARNDVLTGAHTFENASLVGANIPAGFSFDGIETLEGIVPRVLEDMGVE